MVVELKVQYFREFVQDTFATNTIPQYRRISRIKVSLMLNNVNYTPLKRLMGLK